jgi:hypothetical protein
MSRIALSLIVMSSLVFGVTWNSCLGHAVPDVLAEIDKAINEINANSTEWQNIINQLQKKLQGTIDHTIQEELTHFVEHSVAVVSQQAVCTTDILAKRALNFLYRLKQAVKGGSQKTNLTSPIVCQVPSNIELAAMPAGHRIIEASGADFTLRDNNNQLMSLAFWSDTQEKAFAVEESRIGRNTNYNLAVNLDGADIPKFVKDNDINKLLFYWNGSNVEQPQVLVLKHIPGTNEISIGIGNVSLIPRWTNGDRGTDINDDNPFQTDVAGKVFISADQTKVLYNLYMRGRESQPDNTEVEGWKSEAQTGTKIIHLPFGQTITVPVFGEGPGLVAYTAPSGWKFV